MIATHTGGKVVEWQPLATTFDLRSPVDQVPWGRWRYVKNFRVDNTHGWGLRHGFRKFAHDARIPGNSDLNAGPTSAISSLYSHARPSGSRVLMAGTATQVFRFVPDGRWQTLGVLGEGQRMTFASVNDLVAIANGSKPRYWVAGDTVLKDFEELDDIGMTSAGIVAAWNGVLFFGDVTMDGVRVSHRLLWADLNNPLALAPGTGRVSGFQDLDSGSTIKAAMPLGDAFYIFTDRSIWRVTAIGGEEQYGFQRVYSNLNGEGCLASPQGICEVRGNAVYVARDAIYILNPYSPVPERPEWIYRAMRDFDLTSCQDVSIGYHFPTDEIRVSNGVETLCFNWRSQASDVLDHGFTALLSAPVSTAETFYEWLIRVAGCSLGTRVVTISPTGVPDSFTGLAALWSELESLVTERSYVGGAPPAPPPEDANVPALTAEWYYSPYDSTVPPGCQSSYYVFPGNTEPIIGTLPNIATILSDAELAAVNYFQNLDGGPYSVTSGPTWVYSSGFRGGWDIRGRWLPDGLVAGGGYPGAYDADACRQNYDEFDGGWALYFEAQKVFPEILIQDESDHTITCGTITASADNGTNFGSTGTGTTVSHTFVIKNIGSAPLTSVAVTVPAGYTLTDAPATSIAAGGSDTFTVRLDAADSGRFEGNVRVISNDGDEGDCRFFITGYVAASPEVVVEGDGTNISDGSQSPNETNLTDFGSTAIGTTITREFVISNTGESQLILGPLSVPSGFKVMTGTPGAIAAGGSAPIRIKLLATAPGTFSGDVSFTTNDSDEATFNFKITGTVAASQNNACELLPTAGSCTECPDRSLFIGVSASDNCLKQDDPEVFYREIRSGSSYLQSTYGALLRTGSVSFDARDSKRLQKISFDVIASTTSTLTGTVSRSAVPVDISGTGCAVRATALSAKTLVCPTATDTGKSPNAHPYWSLLLDSRYFTFEFRVPTVTGPVWFSRLGIELGIAPLTTS